MAPPPSSDPSARKPELACTSRAKLRSAPMVPGAPMQERQPRGGGEADDQQRSDEPAAVVGQHGHRSEPDRPGLRRRRDGQGGDHPAGRRRSMASPEAASAREGDHIIDVGRVRGQPEPPHDEEHADDRRHASGRGVDARDAGGEPPPRRPRGR